eukprot:5287919-Prorocentrum_lima.AAC.1
MTTRGLGMFVLGSGAGQLLRSKVGCEKWRKHQGSWLRNGSGACTVVATAWDGQGTWMGDAHRISRTQMITTTGLRLRSSCPKCSGRTSGIHGIDAG